MTEHYLRSADKLAENVDNSLRLVQVDVTLAHVCVVRFREVGVQSD